MGIWMNNYVCILIIGGGLVVGGGWMEVIKVMLWN